MGVSSIFALIELFSHRGRAYDILWPKSLLGYCDGGTACDGLKQEYKDNRVRQEPRGRDGSLERRTLQAQGRVAMLRETQQKRCGVTKLAGKWGFGA